MSNVKKYGTFGGVFTPSILTILGVIMFLRLPWIVGQAGLWTTILIIIVAHVISVTTGLSVASIATDKKVEAGGSYYMISRSLGLPIGGTLGLALFVGMSFSISLYLIGFSESFLDYWGMEKNIQNIRILGSVSLLCVAIITIISTSLAMKTQYFIMAAIIASVGSILFGKVDLVPATPMLSAPPIALGFAVLFGIFFPAVTGFEAGVSMSGDLENPKKSIPSGTIWAIIVGLVVYIGLAIFFAYRVDAKELANNPRVLQNITGYLPLLLSGIWGATISSAIGSILGAPRILQATSIDRITPKFFAKGYGKTNEPRNALVLTIVIAEAGILIGELDAIARVVSIFFITAYSFLNLSCVIESWVSPDFRPEFRTPKWVGILGTVTCFVIMIQLDLIAMIGAVIIMGLLFIYIKKKELSLEGGDTLSSIWASIVRHGLFKLTQTPIHERNWRPNMLLFSGGNDSRPYLVEMAKSLADKRGTITNFHLIETEELTKISRSKIVAEEVKDFEGVFSRKIECSDIYEEMTQISKYHGFSGMEPNTILLGRSRSLTNKEKFASLIKSFEAMDYNVLMLDFQKEIGFGDKGRVDVWWSGNGNNFSLSILLVRFLQSSSEWNTTPFQFCLIVEDRSLLEITERKIESMLENYRLPATIKIIYNGIEKKPFHEIIKKESADAALTILGLPNYQMEDSLTISVKISFFAANLKNILWIKANSYFHSMSILPSFSTRKEQEQKGLIFQELNISENPELSGQLNNFFVALNSVLENFYISYVAPVFDNQFNLLKNYKILVEKTYESLLNKKSLQDISLISKKQGEFFDEAQKLIQNYKLQEVNADLETFQIGVQILIQNIEKLIKELPVHLKVHKPRSEFKILRTDAFYLKRYKFFKLIFNFKEQIKIKTPYKSTAKLLVQEIVPPEVNRIINRITNHAYRFINDINKITSTVNEKLTLLQIYIRNSKVNVKSIKNDKIDLELFIENCLEVIRRDSGLSKNGLLNQSKALVSELSNILDQLNVQHLIQRKIRKENSYTKIYESIQEIMSKFTKNYENLLSLADSGVFLFGLQEELRNQINKLIKNLDSNVSDPSLIEVNNLHDYLVTLKKKKSIPKEMIFPIKSIEFNSEKIYWEIDSILADFIETLPEDLEVLTQDSIQMFEENSNFDALVISIPFKKFLEHSIEKELLPEISKYISMLPSLIFQNESIVATLVKNLNAEIIKKNKTSYLKTLNKSINALNSHSIDMNLKLKNVVHAIGKSTEPILEKINIFYLVKNSQNLGRMVAESQKYNSFYRNIFRRIENFSSNIFEKFLHGRSHALLFRKQLEKSVPFQNTDFQNIQKKTVPLVLNKEILIQLPFYYSNLFMNKVNLDKEYFVGRRYELLQAKEIIERQRRGILFIHGEPECGKSWLSEMIATENFKKEKVFVLNHGDNRYSNVSEFYRLLSNTMKVSTNKANFSTVFPEKSILLIDDFEMFWERKENGTKIVNEILYLSQQISNDSLIIVTLNTYTYRLLEKLISIASYCSGVIECQPLSSMEIKEIIMDNHKKTGYKINLNNTDEESLSNYKYAKFLNAIYDISEGLIGNALKIWILSIQKLGKNKIYLKTPPNIDWKSMKNIPADWMVVLVQILLHKKIHINKLSLILELEEDKLNELLGSIERSNLININSQHILTLNPYLQRHIIHILNYKEVI
ncbi:MAG: amino acid permease [Leptospiraceae bacterium]|nr:amino acid permease [Leptospiraceae bacterium]